MLLRVEFGETHLTLAPPAKNPSPILHTLWPHPSPRTKFLLPNLCLLPTFPGFPPPILNLYSAYSPAPSTPWGFTIYRDLPITHTLPLTML